MSIECIRYTPINKNTCLGIAGIFVPKWGLEIYGLTLHQKDGKKWINFPSSMYEKDGEKKYAPYFRLRDADSYNRFCTAVKEAIEKFVASENKQVEELDDGEIPF